MIQFTLKCDEGHQFDSWFQSADAFETLERQGHLSCGVCGSPKVSKALMAPRVASKSRQDEELPILGNPATEVETAVAELRKKVEENSDYVGSSFVEEARAMHLGDKPERAIYGEARLDQAKDLIDEGVPVLPLPFKPKQKLT